MTETDLPRVLCVDDEPNVLAAMERNLFGEFDVTVALYHDQGLAPRAPADVTRGKEPRYFQEAAVREVLLRAMRGQRAANERRVSWGFEPEAPSRAWGAKEQAGNHVRISFGYAGDRQGFQRRQGT